MAFIQTPVLVLLLLSSTAVFAQISFSSTVDLALKNSPRVKMAQDDVAKAEANLVATRTLILPSLSMSLGVGPSYGITTSVPTIFTVNAQSAPVGLSQLNYVRSARAGLEAARAALEDVRGQVEQDSAVAYVSLQRDLEKQAAIAQEHGYGLELEGIVGQRVEAGLDSSMESTEVRRTVVQTRLEQLQLEDEIATLREHLSGLIGLPVEQLRTVAESIPAPADLSAAGGVPASFPYNPALVSAQADAVARREQAIGESRYMWRPQVALVGEYGRISPFNGAATYYNLHGNYNTAYAALQIQIPFFDSSRRARAQEAIADATHAEHSLTVFKAQQDETRGRLQHSLAELATRAELAELDQAIAQGHLDAVMIQVQAQNSQSSSAMTPKDVQKARIQERQRYLDLLDAKFSLRESQIDYLRQTDRLDTWVHSGK